MPTHTGKTMRNSILPPICFSETRPSSRRDVTQPTRSRCRLATALVWAMRSPWIDSTAWASASTAQLREIRHLNDGPERKATTEQGPRGLSPTIPSIRTHGSGNTPKRRPSTLQQSIIPSQTTASQLTRSSWRLERTSRPRRISSPTVNRTDGAG